MRFDPADELDNQTAHQIIREIISDGSLILSNHAKEMMKARKYSTHDVEYILLHGTIVKKELKTKTNNWVYTINGNDLDGDDGSVVVTIIRRMSSIVITVLS
jgi:hypothetical protein